jgi:hypothetical protein
LDHGAWYAFVQVLRRSAPDDDIRLEVSYNQLPSVDWSELPLSDLLKSVVTDDHRRLVALGGIKRIRRDNLRLVWRETSFTDPVEKREARSRICIGIGTGVQCLITMEYWPEDAGRATPVWDEALRTLQLEHYVDDPTRGTTAGLN